MFEYYQNQLCVAARWLYEDGGVMSESNYKALIRREKMDRVSTGGNGRQALIVYESIPYRFRIEIEKIVDPYKEAKHIIFADYIQPDLQAEEFFGSYLLEDGSKLPEKKQKEYTHQAMIFNTVQHIATNVIIQRKFGGNKEMWQKMLESIQNLPSSWLHKRYSNLQSFKRSLKRFQTEGYESIVSGKFLNDNSAKITGEVAEFLLAQYFLPVKYTVPELMDIYNDVRISKGWPEITERAVNTWLEKPEQKRKWFIRRHGREGFMKVFGHTLTRDKSEWFPNSYWAIDGTKLDLVHYSANSTKMGAELKINLLFDIYSEKIIGWDLALSENHASHFRTVKMAVNTAGCKPYLFTYDKQSGHTSARMQDLYSRLVAHGGTHYSHKVGRKSSPAEQIINRFQQQMISKMWYSDKQSIKVRKLDNKPNMDFLVEYKEGLPTKEELYKVVAVLVDRWNNMKKRSFAYTRNEMYAEEPLKYEPIDTLDMISMFWIEETKPKKYYGSGMPMTVEGKDYEYEVYNADGSIDMDFRRKYVGEKLIVRYDPEYLNEMVELWELTDSGDKRFLAHALPKRKHQVIPALMHPGADEWRIKDMEVREQEYLQVLRECEEIEQRTGITVERLIEQQELAVKMHGKMPKELEMATDSAELNQRLSKF